MGLVPAFKVDQFGYLPTARKIALFCDPYVGYNTQTRKQTPTPRVYLKTHPGRQVVPQIRLAPVPWQNGDVHAQSGDKVWTIDFTRFQTAGTYVLWESRSREESAPFAISSTVYVEALKAATRMLFFQRCGVAKSSTYGGVWNDTACHVGAGQDLAARDATDTGNAATEKNLSGGHHDAGDYNKFTVFTCHYLWNLLWAYRLNPSVWSDATNIPESGNGLPDILDECKIALDCLLLHQQGNGSVLSKLGVSASQAGSPPTADTASRYWGAASTASTACAAGAFALGAICFAQAGQSSYATTLTTAAGNAWTWADANPSVNFANTGFSSVNPEPDEWGAAYGRDMSRLIAACYLYHRTGTASYKTYVDAHYTEPQSMQWYFWWPYEQWTQLALYGYTTAAGATASVVTEIKSRANTSLTGTSSASLTPSYAKFDPYAAYLTDGDHIWGSSRIKCEQGNIFLDALRFSVTTDPTNAIREAAAGYLHYMHGVNPQAICYLTNMASYGIARSVGQTWHQWFRHGTNFDEAGVSLYGPAPGLVVGGPNGTYTGNTGSPPSSQPTQKAWKDYNDESPANSWEITETSLSYQAAYIRLLSYFVA